MKQDFYKLEKESEFIDQELVAGDNNLDIAIIGDHVYSITDRESMIIIASDMGNGNGKVIDIVKY